MSDADAFKCLREIRGICEHAHLEGQNTAQAIHTGAHSIALGLIWATVHQALTAAEGTGSDADYEQRSQAALAQLQAFRAALHAEFGASEGS
jgi:hypothetical protein